MTTVMKNRNDEASRAMNLLSGECAVVLIVT
jgi:hypothetical protein